MIKLAAWVVNSGLIVSIIAMNVLALQPCLPDSGRTILSVTTRFHFLHDLITQSMESAFGCSQPLCLLVSMRLKIDV